MDVVTQQKEHKEWDNNFLKTDWSVKQRNKAAFWLLGLCNGFGKAASNILLLQAVKARLVGYVIMLSGAHDMLKRFDPSLSTGLVLLADVVPTVCLPWYLHLFSYTSRVWACTLFALLAFLLVAFSQSVITSLLGVLCASISVILGEVTFLAFTSMFHRSVISSWSSGTGAAGAIGASSYLGLTMVLSPENTCLVMTIVPLGMLACYFGLLTKRPEGNERLAKDTNLGFAEKLRIIRGLFPYMGPLFLVYFSEYTINQGLYEHLLFKGSTMSTSAQYRLYQTVYQCGVFASRSSLQLFPIRRLWIPAGLQALNLVLLALDTKYAWIPTFWPITVWIVFEGLLGGAVYVNAFALISKNSEPAHREFAMGIASVADTCGITLAGVVSIGLNKVFQDQDPR
eukprot:m.75455 g.75455  ORF g.75455 m.75455 type:complete len:398 (-) comp14406_c0_seq6:617-1810(-)